MTRPGRPRAAAPFVAILLVAATATVTVPALANGGIVRISNEPVGPWLVTVYSSPTPLRTGEVDISTLVLDSAGRIADVPITVDANPVGFVAEAVQAPADRRQATNKLFKAAKFDIGVPGRWEFRIRIGAAAGAEQPDPAGRARAEGGTPREDDARRERERPGGVVSFEAVVTKSTILDRPLLLATLVLMPLLVLGWFLLGRDEEPVDEEVDSVKPAAR